MKKNVEDFFKEADELEDRMYCSNNEFIGEIRKLIDKYNLTVCDQCVFQNSKMCDVCQNYSMFIIRKRLIGMK